MWEIMGEAGWVSRDFRLYFGESSIIMGLSFWKSGVDYGMLVEKICGKAQKRGGISSANGKKCRVSHCLIRGNYANTTIQQGGTYL